MFCLESVRVGWGKEGEAAQLQILTVNEGAVLLAPYFLSLSTFVPCSVCVSLLDC